jgi:hypothetical protein
MKKLIPFILFASVILVSCDDEVTEVEKTAEFKKITLTAEDTLSTDPRVKGQGHTGDFAYRIDSINQYSAGFYENLNDTLVGSRIRVCLNYWVKSTNPLKGDCLALSFVKKDGSLTWNSFDVVNYTNKPNEWVNVIDSLTYTADQFSEGGCVIKVFAFSGNKSTIVDFDDVTITLKKVYTVAE